MALLNRTYRGRHGPTDILTFVYERRPWLRGEIYIAADVARRQALRRGVSLRDECLRLCVHGLAHLAGYDHHTPEELCRMRQKEFVALVQIL